MTKLKLNKLQPAQAKVLQMLNQHPYGWVNTFEFRNAGIASPSCCISQLKTRGAIIEKEMRSAIDHVGNVHTRVAHYRFMGWA